MNIQVKKLYQELQDDLSFYQDMGAATVNRLSGALISARSIMIRLKVLVMTEGFANDEAEISFFKSQKPLFVAEQIYLICNVVLRQAVCKRGPGRSLLRRRTETVTNLFQPLRLSISMLPAGGKRSGHRSVFTERWPFRHGAT